jgi:predicted PurR-regulated permease PerM
VGEVRRPAGKPPFDARGRPHPKMRAGEAGTRDPVRTIAHILRATAIAAGLCALLWALADAVVVVILAVILATLLHGLAKELQAGVNAYVRLSDTAAVLLVFLGLALLVCGLGYWSGPKLVSEARQLWGQVSGSLDTLVIRTPADQFG